MRQVDKDALARMGWTALQAALAVVTVDQLGLPKAWVPLVAMLFAAVRAAVAMRMGSPDTVTFTAPEDKAARSADAEF